MYRRKTPHDQIDTYVEQSLANINILKDKNSCYHCFRISRKEEIKLTDAAGETTLCPNCEMDCLLPGEIDLRTLQDVHEYVFKPKRR